MSGKRISREGLEESEGGSELQRESVEGMSE